MSLPYPPLAVSAIDRDRTQENGRPFKTYYKGQAYFSIPLPQQNAAIVGIVLPLPTRKMINFLQTQFTLILEDAEGPKDAKDAEDAEDPENLPKPSTPFNSLYRKGMQQAFGLTQKADAFETYGDQLFALETTVHFDADKPSVEPLRKAPIKPVLYAYGYSEVDDLLHNDRPVQPLQALYDFTTNFYSVEKRFFERPAISDEAAVLAGFMKRIEKTKEEQTDAENEVWIKTPRRFGNHPSHLNIASFILKKDHAASSYDVTDGEKIHRAVTTAVNIAAAHYAEENELTMLYSHQRTKLLTSLPLTVFATPGFTAWDRRIEQAINATTLLHHIKTGRNAFKPKFLYNVRDNLNRYILEGFSL